MPSSDQNIVTVTIQDLNFGVDPWSHKTHLIK